MKKQIYFTMLAACLCVLTNAQTVIPSYVPTNGLVGWWPFNGNAIDESINTNDGTVNGATLTADRFGNANKAYSFDGLISYIKVINNNSLNNNSISVSGWLNANILGSNTQGIVSRWNQSNCQNYSTSIGLVNKFAGASTQYQGGLFSNTSLIANNWIHFVFIQNTNIGGSLYLNGSLDNTNNLSGAISSCTNNLLFGAQVNLNDNSIFRFFNGKLDDIGIWSRALTDCEIKKLYTSGSFSVSSSASNTICVGQSLNLSAAGANSYTWSTGATSQSISVSPTVSTVYTVSTTYSAGCTDSRTFNVTVNVCTGLNETEFATNSVRIFPNPAKEQLNISLNNIALIGKNYTITNALGQVMATGVFNKQTMELTIQQFSSGLYQLNIDGLQENYRFIKE
jgi:hypothetical protein